MELLYLPELQHLQGSLVPSRCSTPSLPFQEANGYMATNSASSPKASLQATDPLMTNGVLAEPTGIGAMAINFTPGQPHYGTMEEQQGERATVKFSSVDYNQRRFSAEIPVLDSYSFFTTHRDPSDSTIRWLCLERLDRLTILRFAVKYSLHPLCVEDALKLEDQQPKVNKYGSHYFIVFPFFRLTPESRRALDSLRQKNRSAYNTFRSTLISPRDAVNAARSLLPATPDLRRRASEKLFKSQHAKKPPATSPFPNNSHSPTPTRPFLYEDWQDFNFRVEQSRLCLFVAGPPSYDTVISMHSKWELFNAEQDEHASLLPTPAASPTRDTFTPNPQLVTVETHANGIHTENGENGVARPGINLPGNGVRADASKHIFDPVVRGLKVDYSILRQGNSKLLTYKILDEVVDHLLPIMRAYRTRLRNFHSLLHTDDVRFKKEHMLIVLGIKSELQRLQRRIRPMIGVIKHLQDDIQIGADIKVYFEDVLDHIVRSLEEIGGCIEMCDSIKEECKSSYDQRTNDVLYTLTIVTTLFVPLQFISSVYGMNFVNREGEPTMPELLWKRGYLFFWVLAGSVFLSSLCYFRLYKRWI